MFIKKDLVSAAQNLLTSGLWIEIERCAIDRKPIGPSPADPVSKQTADAFIRQGYEMALDTIRNLPKQQQEVELEDPLEALKHTDD